MINETNIYAVPLCITQNLNNTLQGLDMNKLKFRGVFLAEGNVTSHVLVTYPLLLITLSTFIKNITGLFALSQVLCKELLSKNYTFLFIDSL